MGFADLSIAEIAEDYNVSVEEIFQLCEQLRIHYVTSETRLALEDVKAIMTELTVRERGSQTDVHQSD